MAFEQLDQLRSAEELRARADEVQAELTEMNVTSDGRSFTEEQREQFAALKEERDEAIKRAKELEAREAMIAEYEHRTENRERLSFSTHRPGSSATKNIYDLSDLPFERTARVEEMQDRAKRSLDKARLNADSADRVAGLLERDHTGELAQRILVTENPVYKRAFSKYIAQAPLTSEEARALSTAQNYAVPAFVDPSVVLTSAGVNNPVRQIARVITITGNTWTGVASTGVTASFSAESTEVGDNSPTLSQPSANVEKAQAFIQYPIEVGDDWGALEAEMGMMLADAKDTLESSKYLKGLGHGSNEPEGLLVGATGTILTASSSVMAVADLYSLVEALNPRWRRRAVFAGSLSAYNKIRQFDSSGGANLWVQLGSGTPARLLGYGDFEWSDYDSTITTPNSSVLTFGDFNEFTIVDRVGMNIEVVPHVFATANNRPSGNRGLYAYWRTTSDVRTATAFKTLKIKP
jgi:HK97 family phage major capsid protein